MREHLTAIWNQTGVKPAQLDTGEFPELMTQQWVDFLELHNGRTSNGFGVNPISYQDIDAWKRLTGRDDVTPADIAILKQLDNVFLKHQAEESGNKKAN